MLAPTVDCFVAVKYAINAGSVSSGTCYTDPLGMILILSQWAFSGNVKSEKKCWFTLESIQWFLLFQKGPFGLNVVRVEHVM